MGSGYTGGGHVFHLNRNVYAEEVESEEEAERLEREIKSEIFEMYKGHPSRNVFLTGRDMADLRVKKTTLLSSFCENFSFGNLYEGSYVDVGIDINEKDENYEFELRIRDGGLLHEEEDLREVVEEHLDPKFRTGAMTT